MHQLTVQWYEMCQSQWVIVVIYGPEPVDDSLGRGLGTHGGECLADVEPRLLVAGCPGRHLCDEVEPTEEQPGTASTPTTIATGSSHFGRDRLSFIMDCHPRRPGPARIRTAISAEALMDTEDL
jgi:hypothetical protein